MAKTKEDTNARVAGRKITNKERVAEQLCMDNIPMGFNKSDESSLSGSTEESL